MSKLKDITSEKFGKLTVLYRLHNDHHKREVYWLCVCEEWKDDFEAFYNWAINNDYKEGLTIDRIDVNGNYTPDNCRWATRKEQQRNRRNTKYITYDGETRTLKELCEILNLNYKRVWQRLYKFDWPIERALEREVNGNH